MENIIRGIKLSLVLSFLSYMGIAQSLTIKVNNQISSLQKNAVDTIITYSIGCLGAWPMYREEGDTSCIVDAKIYLFWVKNGRYFRQVYDDCVNHPILNISKSKFLKTALANMDRIKIAEIKEVKYYENGKTHLVDVDHTCYTNFKFYIGKDYFEKRINNFYLNTKNVELDFTENSSTTINVNYKANQASILKKIKRLVEKETKYYPPFY